MAKPHVTLQPTKGIVTQAATQIFAAYVTAGRVNDEELEKWMKRSIREAIAIARAVDASVQSDEELPDEGTHVLRESSIESAIPTPKNES